MQFDRSTQTMTSEVDRLDLLPRLGLLEGPSDLLATDNMLVCLFTIAICRQVAVKRDSLSDQLHPDNFRQQCQHQIQQSSLGV